jgi:ubiquinol-cytochrome c reductase cytochrome c1 subunit
MRALMLAGVAAGMLAGAVAGLALSAPAIAAEAPHPPSVEWSFNGLFGTFDRGALRRGFQVYSEVCASCHSLNLLSYRNLAAIGFSEDQVKKIAAEVEVTDGPNDEGEMFERPGRPSDRFVSPFPNPQAARASNGGALPPDLSLMTKARKDGANYLHALLTGYADPPSDKEMAEDMSYNPYFPGTQIAMAPPLSEDAVEYADKTKASVTQLASDVTTFLAWAAEPEMEERKNMGVKVVLFLIVLTGLFYAIKRRVWADVH